jgi:pyridoxal phosphate enzyme (YggS family)
MIRQNLNLIRERVKRACEKVKRERDGVLILGATKGRKVEEIKEAIEAGLKCIGENRAQEMMKKVGSLPLDLRVDFIGHLQRNKVKEVVEHCSLIHSVDSLRLAKEIDKVARKKGKKQKILLQVNITREETKYGFSREQLDRAMRDILGLKALRVEGLMTVEPYRQDPEEVRWVFEDLRKLRESLRKKFKISLAEISMGMSGSFEVAVEERATIVRIGEGIFGQR